MKKKVKLNNVKFNNGLIFIALLFFIAIIARITYLSLSNEVDGINLQKFAKSRTGKKEILKAKRGNILDVKGNVLAENVSSYTVIAYLDPSRSEGSRTPQHVVDKELTATKLAPILKMDKKKILSYLNKKLYQTEFGSKGKGLTELAKDEIVALNLPGIDFIETQKRHYPYGNFLSYTIGYARNKNEEDANSNNIVGEMGIESAYNTELNGEDGYTLYQKDRNGYKIPGTKEITKKSENGKDVYLTIDSSIQLFVEQAMNAASKKHKFEWMTVMVADAKTGAILASATSPSFDPNIRNITNYVDFNTGYAYEPGSTMKTFSYMAALETGKYNGKQTYKSGVYQTKDKTEIGDWNRAGWGYITLDQGFALSSNTAVITLIKQYMNGNGNKLKNYYKKLGYGSKTGIELPGEVSGSLNFRYETEILNAGFGQGLTTTPIQNIKALTAISNNGTLLKPYIVSKIVEPNTGKVVYEGKKQELGVVANKKTVSKIKSLMKSVINGTSATSTGYVYKMKGYDIIGKTGTAQVANESGRGYTDDTIRGFAGMFPGNDPQIIMYVAAKNPDGGTPAMTKVVKDVIKNVSNYMGIYDENNSKVTPLQSFTIPSYISKDIDVVKDELKKEKVTIVSLGNGDRVIKQYPESGSKITRIDKVFLLTNGTEIKMPNIIGYSSKEVKTLLGILNIKYEIKGTGYVSEQSIKKDTKLTKDSKLVVTLKPKFKEK